MQNYIQNIRTHLGHRSFIHPAARIIIENDQQEILFIRRADNNQLGLPAGALEANETIEACIRREVQEETGLQLEKLVVIGISSNPQIEAVTYPNGDQIQYFTVEFYSNQWTGTIKPKDELEIKHAQFMPEATKLRLPANERGAFESLAYYKAHGAVLLK
ncbi:MAG: NUDIX domain-containing protein [Bacteroidota bacterium]